MIKGFKDFIAQGNVIDLAVAVVIATAFTAIVNTVVEGLINPLIGAIFQVGDLSGWAFNIPTLTGSTSTIAIGAIIGAAINFFLIAIVVYFVFIYPMNRYKERAARIAGIEPEPELPTEQELLVQIRDLLQQNGGTIPPRPDLPKA